MYGWGSTPSEHKHFKTSMISLELKYLFVADGGDILAFRIQHPVCTGCKMAAFVSGKPRSEQAYFLKRV